MDLGTIKRYWPEWMAWLGLSAYALLKIYDHKLADVGEMLVVLLAGYFMFKQGRGVIKTPLFVFALIALILPVLSWVSGYLQHPQWVEEYPKVDRVFRNFFFLFAAWWLAGRLKKVFVFWLIAAVGLLVTPWFMGDGWQEISRGLAGYRIDYGIRNAQHTALFFGTLLLGLLIFSPRIMRIERIWLRTLAVLLWFVVTLFVGFTLLASQTRAAWLGFAVATVVAVLLLLYINRQRLGKAFFLWGGVASIALVTAGGALLQTSVIEKRLNQESSTMQYIISGEVDNIPYTSIGIRIHLWRSALEFIEQRPLLGWGGKGRELAIQQSEWLPKDTLATFGHVHNLYLDFTLNYGLVGLIWYLSLLGYLTIKSVSAWQKGDMPTDVMLFFFAFLTFWSVMSLFESYFIFWTGRLLFNIVCAGIVTLIWKGATTRSNSDLVEAK